VCKYTNMERAYNEDSYVRHMIDNMVAMMDELQFTPSEMREMAMFASIKFEQTRIRPKTFIQNCEDCKQNVR
jgi:hypothetical protein